MVEQGAAPAGGDTRSHRARAVPGLRPGTLGPPRQELADGAKPLALPGQKRLGAQKGRGSAVPGSQQPPEARPGCRKTPPWRAERRGRFGNKALTHEKLERL